MNRIKFWLTADRLGPDMPLTHVLLHFPSLMRWLCGRKFKSFGPGAEFRPGAYAIGCSGISLGRRVIVRPNTMLFADTGPQGAQIVVEDDAMIGSGVHIYVTTHNFEDRAVPIIDQGFHRAQPVVLKNGCWIGAGSLILPGVSIGRNTVVGAGSVVNRSLPDDVVAIGNPARIIRIIEKR